MRWADKNIYRIPSSILYIYIYSVYSTVYCNIRGNVGTSILYMGEMNRIKGLPTRDIGSKFIRYHSQFLRFPQNIRFGNHSVLLSKTPFESDSAVAMSPGFAHANVSTKWKLYAKVL